MKKYRLFIRLAALVCVLLTLCACSDPSRFASKPVSPLENPKLSVERFVSALRRGNYNECNEYIYNCTFERGDDENAVSGSDDEISSFLQKELEKSYKVRFLSEDTVSVSDSIVSEADYSVNGPDAKVVFYLERLDLDRLKSDMHTDMMTAMDEESTKKHSEDDNILDTVIGTTLDKYRQCDISEYRASFRLTASLVYTDGMWKIVMDDELYNTLIGRR